MGSTRTMFATVKFALSRSKATLVPSGENVGNRSRSPAPLVSATSPEPSALIKAQVVLFLVEAVEDDPATIGRVVGVEVVERGWRRRQRGAGPAVRAHQRDVVAAEVPVEVREGDRLPVGRELGPVGVVVVGPREGELGLAAPVGVHDPDLVVERCRRSARRRGSTQGLSAAGGPVGELGLAAAIRVHDPDLPEAGVAGDRATEDDPLAVGRVGGKGVVVRGVSEPRPVGAGRAEGVDVLARSRSGQVDEGDPAVATRERRRGSAGDRRGPRRRSRRRQERDTRAFCSSTPRASVAPNLHPHGAGANPS